MEKTAQAQLVLDTVVANFNENIEFNYRDVWAFIADKAADNSVSKWLVQLSSDPSNGIRRVRAGTYMRVDPWLSPENKVMTFSYIRTLVNGNDLVEDEEGNLFLVRRVPL